MRLRSIFKKFLHPFSSLILTCILIITCTQLDLEESPGLLLTLLGPNPYILNIGDKYDEPGAIAIDNIDGDISSDIVIDNDEVNTSAIGDYTVTYSVTNSDGEVVTKGRTVKVQDSEGTDVNKPVITLKGGNPLIIYIGQTYTDPGATAYDEVDGDLTDKIKTFDNDLVTTTEPDSFIVWYMVEDNAGNVAIKKRTVVVKSGDDAEPPVITLMGKNPMFVLKDDSYDEPGATAWDNVDGDLTNDIIINSSDVNTAVPGAYYVTYSVSDKAGNDAHEVRAVNVIGEDKDPPVLTLKGTNPMYVIKGDSYNEPGATAYDEIDGDLTDKIVIDNSDVNTSVIGSYNVTYTVSDNAGNVADTVRIVNVAEAVDTTPPVITLKGANPMDVLLNETYYEPGATANDDVDGDLTDSIVIDKSDVNTSVAGTYKVTYTVSDVAGNEAKEERTVNVIDPGDILYVEDFEWGKPAQTTLAQKNFGSGTGFWYGYKDAGSSIDPDPIVDIEFKEIVDSSEGYNNSIGLHVTITLGSENAYAAVGFNLRVLGDYYNLGNLRNFIFQAKGSGKIRVVFKTKKVIEWPNPDEAWGHFGVDINLKSDWTEHTFAASDIKPLPDSPQAGLNWNDADVKDKVTCIDFEASGSGGTIELYLDDIKMEGVKVSDFDSHTNSHK